VCVCGCVIYYTANVHLSVVAAHTEGEERERERERGRKGEGVANLRIL